MVIYQPKPLVITAGQLPTDMPKGYTSNVARKTPKEAKKARQEAVLRLIAADFRKMLIRQPVRKMIEGEEVHKKLKAEEEEREFDRQAKSRHLKKKKKKKKKDAGAFRGGDPARMGRELLRLQTEGMKKVPSRFKLIIPPAH